MLDLLDLIATRLRGDLSEERGAVAIEYGLIALLVALAIVVGATALGGSLNGLFTRVAGTLGG